VGRKTLLYLDPRGRPGGLE